MLDYFIFPEFFLVLSFVANLGTQLNCKLYYSLSELELRKNLELFPQDLYDLLQQFFILFPDLANNPFFAMGESYGGK